MNIQVAKSAGFCFGVNRAVGLVLEQVELGKKVYTLGEIIHNPQMVETLKSKGVKIVDSPLQVPFDGTLIIRSHGVGLSTYDEIQKLGIEYVDATCPYVKKIQRLVSEINNSETIVLIAGDAVHPEVKGITNHCSNKVITFKTAEELEKILIEILSVAQKELIMVSQTTFSGFEWEKSTTIAKKVCTNIKIFDTICKATVTRQTEAEQLAKNSDLMLIVGGKQSSNTAKLFELSSKYCRSVFIENPKELYSCNFEGVGSVGVTAGASTPDCIIKEVQKIMNEINNQEGLSFEELLNQSLENTYKNGDKVVGTVIAVKPTEIVVDIGTKHACYVPLSEMTNDPNAKTEDLAKVGDEITLQIVRINDVDGVCTLSKKRVEAAAGFEKVMAAAETGEVLKGVVTEIIKGGLLALTNGVKVFIPASQATRSKNDSLEPLLKQEVEFKLLEVNRQKRRAVGSIRAVMDTQRKALEEQFWTSVEIGKVYQGVVKSLTSYAVFVDLGGVDGMVHKSELSWARIKQPSDVVKVGDVLEVYIKDIDTEKKKISLGYKKTEDNPWFVLEKNYAVGQEATVKIVSMTPFGAFAQIIPGVDGLIHISQISNERIAQPQDVLSIGQEVQVKITELDFEKKRVSLSMKALIEDKAIEEQTEQPAE